MIRKWRFSLKSMPAQLVIFHMCYTYLPTMWGDEIGEYGSLPYPTLPKLYLPCIFYARCPEYRMQTKGSSLYWNVCTYTRYKLAYLQYFAWLWTSQLYSFVAFYVNMINIIPTFITIIIINISFILLLLITRCRLARPTSQSSWNDCFYTLVSQSILIR